VLNLEMAKVRSSIDLLARERPVPQQRCDEGPVVRSGPVDIVAIAASTGGPPAIQAIITSLPADLGASIVISQHMPAGFTRSFAERLNKLSPLIVAEASPGERIRPGMVFIAPGGQHLLVRRDRDGLYAEIVERGPADKYVPSADRMMASVAEVCGPAALGIVLTGMGNDGAQGAAAIRRQQGQCLAESEESSVIFGMPQEAIRAGAVDKVVPLAAMADEIVARCGGNAG